MRQGVNKTDFWEERYLKNKMPWDIGEAAPAFVKYFCSRDLPRQVSTAWQAPTGLKIAVLGCGRGHDAFYLANINNLEVYGFDFSESAVKFCNEAKEKKNLKNIFFYNVNFFDLKKENQWKGFFDFVIEHTSLCAIDPLRRKEYADLIKYLLKPKGKLAGLFFIRPIELGGPPFGITQEEIRDLFKNNFAEVEKLHYESCPHTFTGEEYFGVFEKKVQ